MNTHEEYVTYAQAKALKELGFDWPCRYLATSEDAPDGQYWTCPVTGPVCNHECNVRSYTIPAQVVVCRWLREEKGLSIRLNHSFANDWFYDLLNLKNEEYEDSPNFYPTYESALSAGIDRALELLKGGEECCCR